MAILKYNKWTKKSSKIYKKLTVGRGTSHHSLGKKPFVNIIPPSKVIELNVQHDSGQTWVKCWRTWKTYDLWPESCWTFYFITFEGGMILTNGFFPMKDD